MRRNPDEDLRALQRDALTGDPQAARRLQAAVARAGVPVEPYLPAIQAQFTRPELYLLCALRFWSTTTPGFGPYDRGRYVACLQRSVRDVARRQGITTPELNVATRSLLAKGLIEQGGTTASGRWLRLTDLGAVASEACQGLELPPWHWQRSFPLKPSGGVLDPKDWNAVARAAVEISRAAQRIPATPPEAARDSRFDRGPRHAVLDRLREINAEWERHNREAAFGAEGTRGRIFFHVLYALWLGYTLEEALAAHASRGEIAPPEFIALTGNPPRSAVAQECREHPWLTRAQARRIAADHERMRRRNPDEDVQRLVRAVRADPGNRRAWIELLILASRRGLRVMVAEWAGDRILPRQVKGVYHNDALHGAYGVLVSIAGAPPDAPPAWSVDLDEAVRTLTIEGVNPLTGVEANRLLLDGRGALRVASSTTDAVAASYAAGKARGMAQACQDYGPIVMHGAAGMLTTDARRVAELARRVQARRVPREPSPMIGGNPDEDARRLARDRDAGVFLDALGVERALAHYQRAGIPVLRLVVKPTVDGFTLFAWEPTDPNVNIGSHPWMLFSAFGGGIPLAYLSEEKIRAKIARMIAGARSKGFEVVVDRNQGLCPACVVEDRGGAPCPEHGSASNPDEELRALRRAARTGGPVERQRLEAALARRGLGMKASVRRARAASVRMTAQGLVALAASVGASNAIAASQAFREGRRGVYFGIEPGLDDHNFLVAVLANAYGRRVPKRYAPAVYQAHDNAFRRVVEEQLGRQSAPNPRSVPLAVARRHADSRGDRAALEAQVRAFARRHGRLPASVTIS